MHLSIQVLCSVELKYVVHSIRREVMRLKKVTYFVPMYYSASITLLEV